MADFVRVFGSNFKMLVYFALVCAGMNIFAGAAAAAEIVAVRFGVTSASQTRIVFDSNGLPSHRLKADGQGEGRLDVAFESATLAKGLSASGKGAGHVAGYAALQKDAAAVVSLSFARGAKIKDVLVIPPSAANAHHRLVIDLVSAKPADLVASLPAPKYESITEVIEAVTPTPAGSAAPFAVAEPPTLASSTLRPVIVIDAGHGGTDPGAAGPAGSKESAATLSAAAALSEILEGTGRYDVVLTRSTDSRLAHEERSRIAREAKADLFISLHADAHADSKVRGGSVYTLSDEGTERSAREALAKGNYAVFDLDIGEEDPQVGGILYNLAQRRTENESDLFAEILIKKLAGVTPLLNNTHRRGNFKVLLAPDVPAILLELAFISNKQDEANLRSPTWRKRSMGAVADAIDAYFEKRAALGIQASTGAAATPR